MPRPETERSGIFGKIPDLDRDRRVWSGPDQVLIGLGPNFPNTTRNNSLLAGPGTAGPAAGSLAARITTTPVTGVAGPSIAPILGAPLLVNPSVPLPAASTSMDVDYGSPLTDPPSEGNNCDASSRHEDLDAPVSM